MNQSKILINNNLNNNNFYKMIIVSVTIALTLLINKIIMINLINKLFKEQHYIYNNDFFTYNIFIRIINIICKNKLYTYI